MPSLANKSPAPEFSFIIGTLGERPKQLTRCLASIQQAALRLDSTGRVEIIVVMQGVGVELLASGPIEVQVLGVNRTGLAAARNAGAAIARGQYLVFLDDDAEADNDFLRVFGDVLRRYPSIQAVCGRILDISSRQPMVAGFWNTQETWIGYRTYRLFMGSAHVLHRSLLTHFGPLDEDFGAGAKYHSAEETEFLFRLLEAGERVLYVPALRVFHPAATPSLDKRRRYCAGFGAACAKRILNHPRRSFTYLWLIIKPICGALVRLPFLMLGQPTLAQVRLAILRGLTAGFFNYWTNRG